MRGLFWLCLVVGAPWLLSMSADQHGPVQQIGQARLLIAPAGIPPMSDKASLPLQLPLRMPVSGLPHELPGPRTWLQMRFDLPAEQATFWGILLPYLYGGGEIWLDGHQLAGIPAATSDLHVRWERPHLLVVPPYLLHAGANIVWLQAMPVAGETSLAVPAPLVGPLTDLGPLYDGRMFWVHTVPQMTVAACLAVATFVLLIWWRLPQEALYGWFGLATLLWGVRTLTFVMEAVTTERWLLWRLVYLSSTGGFIVVMFIFAANLAQLRSRWLERGLILYLLAGPVWFAWHGVDSDALVNRVWTAGLIPVAVGTVALSLLNVWRLRTAGSLLLPGALALATVCGIHDYLLVWKPEWLGRLAPAWAGQRYFLLHHGANGLLMIMGLLLATRFVRTLRSLRHLNETLESRIADHEKALADNYARLAFLERQNAAADERKLIMRDLHDGLGSKLFTSLSRAERGAMDLPQMAASLRACIADMRLALDALAPDAPDLSSTFGDFLFRWQAELDAVGVRCVWHIDIAEGQVVLSPHATLQVLRIAQEALTNVAKHACATRVDLLLQYRDGGLQLAIEDNGIGVPKMPSSGGRGLQNMRARSSQLGGTLRIERADGRGTRLLLTLPCAPARS